MIEERKITIEGRLYTVVISDEHEALLAADAAGRAVIGLWNPEDADQDLSPARFAAEHLDDVDHVYMERAVRRKMGMPWIISATKRLIIREMCMEDFSSIETFDTPESLREYIRCQYGFYQYGIWVVVQKEDGQVVGQAGLSHLELGEETVLQLGYHIFAPYQRRGYGREACLEIMRYAAKSLDCPIYARIDASNEASIRLAVSCGFRPVSAFRESQMLLVQRCINNYFKKPSPAESFQRYNGSEPRCCLYGWNC